MEHLDDVAHAYLQQIHTTLPSDGEFQRFPLATLLTDT